MAPPVSRLARTLDAVGLVLLVAGIGLWLYAFLGLRELQGVRPEAGAAPFAALARADRLSRLSTTGVVLGAAGLAVAVLAAAVGRRRPAGTP